MLLEKPLTDSLRQDREFVAWLNANHPQSIMLAFQRRFDAPLQYARQLLEAGTIGRAFKIVSALEDSGPPHAEYRSGGLLVDMSVHNVDEILWMTGKRPIAAGSMGSLVYSQAFSPVKEDFDDGYIRLWFDDRMIAQIEVSRNHVSGYRVETWIFGEKGHIHVGRFEQKPLGSRRRDLRARPTDRPQDVHHAGLRAPGPRVRRPLRPGLPRRARSLHRAVPEGRALLGQSQ